MILFLENGITVTSRLSSSLGFEACRYPHLRLLGGARQKEGWSSNESMALAMVEELLKSS